MNGIVKTLREGDSGLNTPNLTGMTGVIGQFSKINVVTHVGRADPYVETGSSRDPPTGYSLKCVNAR
jgi:hypothetical protein